MTECPFLQESCKKFNPCSLAAEKEVKCPLLQCPAFACLSPERGTFTDPRDGRAYKTVKIGEQVWLAENLAFDYAGSKVYGNDLGNLSKYGRLYTWVQAKRACPPGWHLPSNEEWDKLYRYADGDKGTGRPYKSKTAGKYLKSREGWKDNEGKSGNGTDAYGFSALPGGYGDSGSNFYNAGSYGFWWSASENNGSFACLRRMYYNYEDAGWNFIDKYNLNSVRCLQDGGAK